LILDAIDIHKSYSTGMRKSLEVLKGVDFSVEEGEMVALVGPSGAGKSTLLHILGGLDSPSKGKVIIGGKSIYKLSDKKLARLRAENIGFIFQFYHLLGEFTALENVMMPVMVKEDLRKTRWLEEKSQELLAQVGLADRVKHRPMEMSGGEQQRVAIARALINEPKVLLCDEPTGNLDSETGDQIMDILLNLNEKKKQTMVLVTHSDEVARACHRIIRMKDGVVEEVEQVREHKDFVEVVEERLEV